MENSMESPQKLKTELSRDSVTSLLGTHPPKFKLEYQRDICTPMFIAVPSTMAKTQKQPECPLMDECVKKTWQIYLKWTIMQSEKEKILAFATTWVNFENARERKINTV